MVDASPKIGRSVAARGMAWSGMTVAFGKGMSFVSQLALGYLLTVDSYAVFAAATAALTFVTGFQNSGLSKILIQRQDEYEDILPYFAGFAFYLGLMGTVVLMLMAVVLARLYEMPMLLPVLCFSAITIPIFSLNSIYAARQSINLEFRSQSFYSMAYNVAYYGALIALAFIGASYYSVALATLLAAALLHLLYIRGMGALKIRFLFSRQAFSSVFQSLKWTIASSYLFGFGLNGGYLILGGMLEKEDLGYYFFGFMLTANIGHLLSLAINQTLMPIFSKINDDPVYLRSAFDKATQVITFLSVAVCVVIVAFLPEAVHVLWAGKWDSAIFIAVVMGISFPLRMFSSIGMAVLEAQGFWRLRTYLLCHDAAGVMIFAGAGAYLGGANGAAIGVSVHQAINGLLAFPFGMKAIGFSSAEIPRYMIRTSAAFFIAIPVMLWVKYEVPTQQSLAGMALSTGSVAIFGGVLFIAAAFFTNRQFIQYSLSVIKKRA